MKGKKNEAGDRGERERLMEDGGEERKKERERDSER